MGRMAMSILDKVVAIGCRVVYDMQCMSAFQTSSRAVGELGCFRTAEYSTVDVEPGQIASKSGERQASAASNVEDRRMAAFACA